MYPELLGDTVCFWLLKTPEKKSSSYEKQEKTEKNVTVICVLFAGVIDDEKEKKNNQWESCFLFMFDEDVIYISSSTILLPF